MSFPMNKTLVITGGSSGIGLAAAMLFVEKGWRVFELSRHGSSHDGIVHVDCDVTVPESVQAAVTEVLKQTEAIDVLISNAGYGISGAIEFTALEDAKRQMDVNFFGALNIVQAVLPCMRERHNGRILSSILFGKQGGNQCISIGTGQRGTGIQYIRRGSDAG